MGLKKIKLENKEYNVSILDLLRLLDPSKTGKFMTILLNELKFYNKSVPLGHRDIKQLSNQIEMQMTYEKTWYLSSNIEQVAYDLSRTIQELNEQLS